MKGTLMLFFSSWFDTNFHCLSFIYLLILAALGHVGSWFPDQESNPHALHWKHRVLSTGWPDKSLILSLFDTLTRRLMAAIVMSVSTSFDWSKQAILPCVSSEYQGSSILLRKGSGNCYIILICKKMNRGAKPPRHKMVNLLKAKIVSQKYMHIYCHLTISMLYRYECDIKHKYAWNIKHITYRIIFTYYCIYDILCNLYIIEI